jgi:ubiquinone/menaquinone biosynthesis C-methylase UbiE
VPVTSIGLIFFPDPPRGLAEFRRVLRPGGRAAVSVNTVPERSFNTRINITHRLGHCQSTARSLYASCEMQSIPAMKDRTRLRKACGQRQKEAALSLPPRKAASAG